MKNLFLLPTDKPSRLHFDNKLFLSPRHQLSNSINSIVEGRNIYITSDEEIKDGDWWVSKGGTYVSKDNVEWCNKSKYKKIVLTTDQDLIKDGVQKIDDEFLEWFVNNPSCEEIKVFKDERLEEEQDFHFYEIIIPKEEPKQDAIEYSLNAFKVPKEYFGKEEPKQECKDCNTSLEDCTCIEDTIDMKQETTLEEIVNALSIKEAKDLDLVLRGIEYQRNKNKNLYSEEEVLELLQNFNQNAMEYIKEDEKSIMTFVTLKKWFEQFKKK
jgi:hypothetical protein